MLNHQRSTAAAPSRVVILGARGFISTHLQAWCARKGWTFRAIGSAEIDLTRSENAPALGKLLRPDDAVVMTSAVTPEKGRDYHAFMANISMVHTVCMAFEKARCHHFVYLSSDAVYDANKIPLDEDSTREPVDTYSLSHVAREMILSTELEARGVAVCVLRLTNIYGPGDTHNAYGPNRFVRSAVREGRIELFGQGEEKRSHVFIDDAVKLIGLSLERQSTGTLNVAVRRAVTFREVADAVVRAVARPVQLVFSPRTVRPIHKPYKPTQVFRFIYNLGRPIGPIVHRTFVNSAVFAAFPGFEFTPLDEGLESVVKVESGAPRQDATCRQPS